FHRDLVGMDEPVLLARAGDVHPDLRVVTPDRLEQVELRLDVDAERGGGLVERRLHVRLRGEVEDALRLDRRHELFDGARVRELAVEKGHATTAAVVAERPARRIPALDHLDLVLGGQDLEVLGTRTPPVRRVDRDVWVVGEDVLREVAAGEAGDTREQDPHRAKRSKEYAALP